MMLSIFMIEAMWVESFSWNLALEVARLFQETPKLGGRAGAPWQAAAASDDSDRLHCVGHGSCKLV